MFVRIDEQSGSLFGKGAGGFSGWSKAKAALDAAINSTCQASGIQMIIPPWTLHDLRRSFVTHVSELKLAQPHIIEAIVNHVSGQLAGIAGVLAVCADVARHYFRRLRYTRAPAAIVTAPSDTTSTSGFFFR